MNIDENAPNASEAAEFLQRMRQHLAEEDKELQQIDEAIEEAKRKSKYVIPDPQP